MQHNVLSKATYILSVLGHNTGFHVVLPLGQMIRVGTLKRLQVGNLHNFHTVQQVIMLYKKVIPTHIIDLTILDKAQSCKRVELLLLHTT